MSNRNKTMKKNKKSAERKACLLAAIALSAALFGGQLPMETLPVYALESQDDTPGSVIPDNITIDQPMALADIGLPGIAYGTLEWADGSYVPDRRVQSCAVVLTPAQGVDLSNVSGWDAATGTVTGYINVIVSSFSEKADSFADDTATEITGTPSGEYEENTELPTLGVTGTPAPSVTGTSDADGSDILVPADGSLDAKDDGEDSSDADATTENTIEDKKEDSQAEDSEDGNSEDDSEKKSEDGEDQDMVSGDDADTVDQDDENQKDNSGTSDEKNDNDNNIFDNPIEPDAKDDRPSDVEEDLSDEEKAARAELNHTCDGITVSGINLPWYVQFRVSSGDSYQFANESDAMIFQSYEFELWDLQNNTEYEIPSGEYISVTVPVKAGYDYTIEHLLDNGATETIIPSVDGDTMVFSTHSFSPFGIAGSKQLVGPDTGDTTEDSDTAETATPTPTVSAQTTPASGNQSVDMNGNNDNNSADTGSDNSNTDSNNNNNNNNNNSSTDADNENLTDNSGSGSSVTQTDSATDSASAKDSKTVNTGDTTTILPFVVLFLAAAVIAGVVVFIKRKKK